MTDYVLDSTNFIRPESIRAASPPGETEKYKGIIRYGGTPYLKWKNTDPDEIAAYKSARLPVAWVFEIGGSSAISNRSVGQAHATDTLRDAQQCGYNMRACHVVAQDKDYTGIDWMGAVAEYFRGWHDIFDPEKIIVSGYGGYDVVKFLFDEGLIQIGWQTKAWSGSRLEPRCALYQQLGYVYPGGVQADWNLVFPEGADWGQDLVQRSNFMLTDEQERRLNLAVDQILGSAIPGQLDFKSSLRSISARIDTLNTLVKSDDQLFTDGQTAILTAIAHVNAATWTDEQVTQFANQVATQVSSLGITIDPNAILDALKLRLEE